MEDNGRGLIATAERDPGVIAIVDGQKRISYAELLEASRHIAGGLEDMGLQKGDHVLTLLQNTWQAAVLHWACQISGIIITPLNWRANADELTYFAADSDARAIIYQEISAQAVIGAEIDDLPKISIEAAGAEAVDFDELLRARSMTGAPRAGADDTSLMLYTSGTTGAGKGVPRSHRAERAAAIAHIAQNRYGHGERNLGVMPLYHTMGVRVLLAMSVVSGCYVCQPRFDATQALVGAVSSELVSGAIP